MVTKQMAYTSPGDVALDYRAGNISWMRAVTILMTQFGWSQTDSEELLSETGAPPPHDITDPDPGNGGNGAGDGNGADPSDPGVSPGDYSLVGIVAFLWLLSKVF